MILIIGGTGVIGRHVTTALAGRQDVRALARSDAAAAALTDLGIVEVVRGDLADPGSLPAAFAGVDRLFITTPFSSDQAELEHAAVDAAEAAGVQHVVKVSAFGAEQEHPIAFGRAHREIEQWLTTSKMTATVLRPITFMTNLYMQADYIKQGQIVFPAGQAHVPFVDTRDIAAVAVAELLATTPTNGPLFLTGPEAITYEQVAQALTKALGHPVAYMSPSVEEWRQGLLDAGLPAVFADGLAESFDVLHQNPDIQTSTAVPDALGRPATSLEQWLTDEGAATIRAAAN